MILREFIENCMINQNLVVCSEETREVLIDCNAMHIDKYLDSQVTHIFAISENIIGVQVIV